MEHETPAAGDWAWLKTPAGVVLDGGALTFVHHMPVAEVFRAFDLDPGSARTMTAAESLSDPVLGTAGFHDGPQWIRVARSGEWTVVIEHGQQKVHVDGIDGQLAQDTDVVFAAANENEPVVVSHLSHGEFVFAFECGAPYDSRAGLRPDLFDDAMDAAGLLEFPQRGPLGEILVAMMTILGRHFGFSLTPEAVLGPLPTAYRKYRYAPRPPGFGRNRW